MMTEEFFDSKHFFKEVDESRPRQARGKKY